MLVNAGERILNCFQLNALRISFEKICVSPPYLLGRFWKILFNFFYYNLSNKDDST